MDQSRGFPYFDPEFDSIMERIPPPRVCIDNDTCLDSTLVKVDSANWHGILLELVQVLTDLNLVVSKSYISSDGGWLMDVFHVTDQLGNKLTDHAFIGYIQQSLSSPRKRDSQRPAEVNNCLGNLAGFGHVASQSTVLEITTTDCPGILSEVIAVLTGLSCNVDSGVVWTHNGRAAGIFFLTDTSTGLPVSEDTRLVNIEEQVQCVVEARHFSGVPWRVSLSGPTACRFHTERRLHQLMQEDMEYDAGPSQPPVAAMDEKCLYGGCGSNGDEAACCPLVSIDSWKERDYSVVNVTSMDRPKLMFDTVCTLTGLEYEVFHASITSHGSLSVQEYYVRRLDGGTPELERERQKVIRCLVAAVQRRVTHGLKVEMKMADRHGLISDLTRSFRENSLSVERADWTKKEGSIVGSFYVMDVSSSSGDANDLNLGRLEVVRSEIGVGIYFNVNGDRNNNNNNNYNNGGGRRGWLATDSFNSSSSTSQLGGVRTWSLTKEKVAEPKLTLGSLLWSRIVGSIRS